MADTIFLIVFVAFGAVSWSLVVLCDRLARGSHERN